jgi:hypothetical protein
VHDRLRAGISGNMVDRAEIAELEGRRIFKTGVAGCPGELTGGTIQGVTGIVGIFGEKIGGENQRVAGMDRDGVFAIVIGIAIERSDDD